MTQQVKMPEPVAKIGSTFQLLWFGARTITEIAGQSGATVGSRLITTDQAEAYKDACVREALEKAEKKVHAALYPTNPKSDWTEAAHEHAASARWAASAIRALIQPTKESKNG